MLVLGMSESSHSRTHSNCPRTAQDLPCQHSVMVGRRLPEGCWQLMAAGRKGAVVLAGEGTSGLSVLTQAALVKLSGSQNKIKLEEIRTGVGDGGLGAGGWRGGGGGGLGVMGGGAERVGVPDQNVLHTCMKFSKHKF